MTMGACEQLRGRLNDFLDGALDGPHAVALSAHLETCLECRRELAALKATQELVRAAAVPAIGAARRRALDGLRRVPTVAAGAPVRVHRRPAAAISAALVAAVMLAILCVSPRHVAESGLTRRPTRTALRAGGLPTPGELDQMVSLHAAQSVAIIPGDDSDQQTTLADANSRLQIGKN